MFTETIRLIASSELHCPDITVMVDWALQTNQLPIYLRCGVIRGQLSGHSHREGRQSMLTGDTAKEKSRRGNQH